MPESSLDDRRWREILDGIKDGTCTPFLGAGACYGVLPLGGEIARRWSDHPGDPRDRYPLPDADSLPRVAQYLAVKYHAMWPKDLLVREYFQDPKPPDFSQDDEPHGVLASLPFPVYITTNYDRFMMSALEHRRKNPIRAYCAWNDALRKRDKANFNLLRDHHPDPQNPAVYHLHGHAEKRDSLVLTEDDYFDFLVGMSNPKLLPPRIQDAMSQSLLFIGYSLADWNFRVLFRGILAALPGSARRPHVTVQLPPESTRAGGTDEVKAYLSDYYKKLEITVCWQTAREFCGELRRRWEVDQHGR